MKLDLICGLDFMNELLFRNEAFCVVGKEIGILDNLHMFQDKLDLKSKKYLILLEEKDKTIIICNGNKLLSEASLGGYSYEAIGEAKKAVIIEVRHDYSSKGLLILPIPNITLNEQIWFGSSFQLIEHTEFYHRYLSMLPF